MAVAADIRSIKRRIDDYLWQDSSETLRALRSFLKENILPFSHAAIVGGLARDFALKGKKGFKSDVDIVIDSPVEEISELANKLSATPNRFGGYSYKGSRWKVDFWALESTWAAKEGHVSISSLEDILGATFFDCDAILYDLKNHSVVVDDGYLGRLKEKKIEINLMPNPSISGNTLRAVRRILLWNMDPGPRLRDFLYHSLTDDLLKEISEVEGRLYASSVTAKFENAQKLLDVLMDSGKRIRFGTSSAQQMDLPNV
jgi:hypothetical protein